MLALPFYAGYSIYRIVNKYMIPYLILDYLSNGENHHYLDGSDQAFHNLNTLGALGLDESNVLSYLDLYISYVYERGHSLHFLVDPEQSHAQSKVTLDAQTRTYSIETPLIYHDNTVPGAVKITQDGKITVLSPVNASFLHELKPQRDIPYRHPLEKQIIEQSISILSETDIGQNLLKGMEKCNAEIRVIGSPNYHGLITNDCVIYMMMPAAEQNAKYFQALVLAYALRDIRQIADGYAHPHIAADMEIFLNINYGKNIDMISVMFDVVAEFETKGAPEALQALGKMNLMEVYNAWKNGLRNEALMDVYFEALRKDDIMKR